MASRWDGAEPPRREVWKRPGRLLEVVGFRGGSFRLGVVEQRQSRKPSIDTQPAIATRCAAGRSAELYCRRFV